MRDFVSERIDDELKLLSRDLRQRERRGLRQRRNVIGTAVGVEETNGEPTGEPALVIYVTTKLAEHELSPEDILPETIETEQGDTVPVDVKEVGGEFHGSSASPTEQVGRPSPARRRRINPTPGGVSIAREGVQIGTCSALLRDSSGRPVMLSALHIFSTDGEYGADVAGTPVVQPAPSHSVNYEQIGTVRETSDYRLNSTQRATTDVAIIDVNEAAVHPSYLGYGPASSTGRTRFNRRVINFNHNSGTVSGVLLERDVETSINHHWGGRVEMEGLESYERISSAGSSGALVGHIDPDKGGFEITGLHIAGSPTRSLMVPWEAIEEEFGRLTPARSREDTGVSGGGGEPAPEPEPEPEPEPVAPSEIDVAAGETLTIGSGEFSTVSSPFVIAGKVELGGELNIQDEQ